MKSADRPRMLLATLLATLLGLSAEAARADPPGGWQRLSPEHQQVLGDFRERWDSMPPERRERLINRAERWRQLPPEQREAIRERWREIKPLPPEAREALRQRWESMSPDERRQTVIELRQRHEMHAPPPPPPFPPR